MNSLTKTIKRLIISDAYVSLNLLCLFLLTIVIPATAAADNPVVDVWYGPTQVFGELGEPQSWVNVLGSVSDPDGIAALRYSLNGGITLPLSIGPDDRRLDEAGDFNVEIGYWELSAGLNEVAITATDNLGNTTISTVNVDYETGNIWPVNYSIDWSTVNNIQNVAQVVDGLWIRDGNDVRVGQLGYDRIIAIGDTLWTDYEITVPITIHGKEPPGPLSGAGGIGIILRWQGHYDWDGSQPTWGYEPFGGGAGCNFSSEPDNTCQLSLNGENWGIGPSPDLALSFPGRYWWKARVETSDNGSSIYNFKWWDDGQSEPLDWQMTGTEQGDLQSGSVLLVAHHADVSFGNVTITSLENQPPPPPVSDLVAGVPQSGFLAQGEWAFYKIDTTNITPLEVVLSDLSADLDLYVKARALPLTSYDCLSDNGGTAQEVCSFPNPGNTTWYIGVYGYRAGNYTITASLDIPVECGADEVLDCDGNCAPQSLIGDGICHDGTAGANFNCAQFENDAGDCLPSAVLLESGVPQSGSVAQGEWAFYQIDSSDSATALDVLLSDLSADIDLYVKAGALPLTSYDCLSDNGGTGQEVCSFPNPGNTTWYIGVYGFRAGSYDITATLTAPVECDAGEVLDCDGNCAPQSLIGDGICHDGTAGANFSCAEFGNDGGDCLPSATLLESGVPQSGSVARWEWVYYRIDSSDSDSALDVVLDDLSADLDLHVRAGDLPTLTEYDCRPYASGRTQEVCSFPNPGNTTWYIGVYGFRAGSYDINATLTAPVECDAGEVPDCDGNCAAQSLIGDGICHDGTAGANFSCAQFGNDGGDCLPSATLLESGVPQSGSVAQWEWVYYRIDSSDSDSALDVVLDDLSADLDLHVRAGDLPTLTEYDCRPYVSGRTQEVCNFSDPGNTTWFIGIHGFRAGSYYVIATLN